MAEFEILPAIDLRAGRVVRLLEGDFERETAYSDDPVATAVELVAEGSRWLHVVDLDGARHGKPVQAALVGEIIEAVGGLTRVEVGGGIRSVASATAFLEGGAARVVIGTGAITTSLANQLVLLFGPERVVVALDVRGGMAVGGGWQVGGGATDLDEAVSRLLTQGVNTFEVTAIDRDGTLAGPDLELLIRILVVAPNASVIASGGVRSVGDLIDLARLGCAGAIVGRAIYEGRLDLRSALTDGHLRGQ